MERLERVGRLFESGASEGLFLGGAYQVLRRVSDGGDGPVGLVAAGAVGLASEEPRRLIESETLFDLASLTKVLATTTAILQLAEAGALHLEDPAMRFLEPDAAAPLQGITLRHLLTHTAGLPAWRQYHSRGLDREAILAAVRTAARERPPGSRYVYSDLGFILLGVVVERAAGQPLEEYVRERICGPLGMAATYLPDREPNVFAVTRCPDRGRLLAGEVHDGNCDAMGGTAGHAGLFGTVGDVVRFASMLLSGGALQGRRVLSPLAVAAMSRPQIPPEVGGSTLGWFIRPNGMLPAGDLLPPDTFGHTGFTGTSLLVSPSLGLAVVLLTNRVYHEREAAEFLRFRRRFHNAVAGALTETRSYGDTERAE